LEKAILLLSGGIDSAALLWKVVRDHEIVALTIKHGRANKMEVKAAKALARLAGVAEHIVFKMDVILELEEHERGASAKMGVPSSYIPARNAVLFGIAAHFAELRGASVIFTGQIRDDEFPDSGQGFIDAYNEIIAVGKPPRLGATTRIVAPLITMKKGEVVRMAVQLGVPIRKTWSCHLDGKAPCGACDGCRSVSAFLEGAHP
jgi:7-cyano-7-deazaguanine synthase